MIPTSMDSADSGKNHRNPRFPRVFPDWSRAASTPRRNPGNSCRHVHSLVRLSTWQFHLTVATMVHIADDDGSWYAHLTITA